MTVKRTNAEEIQAGAAEGSVLPDVVKSCCILTASKTKKRRIVSSGSSVSSIDSTEEKDNLMLARPVKKAGKKQMRYEPDVPVRYLLHLGSVGLILLFSISSPYLFYTLI
jgi:hypothetical protein